MSVTKVLKGDILESGAQTLVNTVNTVGIMGKGIALEFKKRFPDMFEDYLLRCEAGEVQLGKPYLFRRLLPPWIINFPTKEHWRAVSRLDAIIDGLEFLERHIETWGITSMAVPPLGCGHGQLEWRVVGPTLFRYLDRLNIPVELYAPFEVSDSEIDPNFLVASTESAGPGETPRVTAEMVAVADIAGRLGDAPHAWPVGHTRFQKLAYFATAAGIPTGLDFVEKPYGPFSTQLKKWLSRLVNNAVLVERRTRGNLIELLPGSTFGDAKARYSRRLIQYEEAARRVTDLLSRLDSKHLELAATIHFATGALRKQGRTPSTLDVLNAVMHWKRRRKPPLEQRVVVELINQLVALGWLEVRLQDTEAKDDQLSYA